PLAQSAGQVADHDLDVAFAGAWRHFEAHPPQLSPEARQLQQRLESSQRQLDADTEQVKRLTAALEKASDAEKPAIQDRLELAQSQMELEKDEVQEAGEDLLQAGGNLHQRIQMMQQEHEATMRNVAAAPAPAASPLATLRGLVGQVRRWLALRGKRREIAAAERRAADSAAQRRPTLRDERITARRRLADVYGQWDALLAGQERTLLHDCLSRVAIVLAALLALLFANRWLERLLGRAPIDRRQLGTLRSV